MESDGKERRQNHMEQLQQLKDDIKSDIGEIKMSLALLQKTVDTNHHAIKNNINSHFMMIETQTISLKKHEKTLYGEDDPGLAGKVNILEKQLKDHIFSDRWIFGIIITLLLAIIGKQFDIY